jgi:hypothetical protein
VVYKHNPVHSSPIIDERWVHLALSGEWRSVDAACHSTVGIRVKIHADLFSSLPPFAGETNPTPRAPRAKSANGTTERTRKEKKKPQLDPKNDYHDVDLNMSTSPEAPKTSAEKKRKKDTSLTSLVSSRKLVTKKTKTSKETVSPSARKTAPIRDPSQTPMPMKDRACNQCQTKKIKCNKDKPTCNQCQRGLWICQYELAGAKKRSKNGCVNCKTRRRKCTEERPFCAHCLRIDEDCEYADYS